MSRRRAAAAVCTIVALAASCLRLPGHEQAIHDLSDRYLAALARGDFDAAYRLTDQDFRSLCPRARYAEAMASTSRYAGSPPPAALTVHLLNGVRAAADLTVVDSSGQRQLTWQFVKEGSRWYVYEDVALCGIRL